MLINDAESPNVHDIDRWRGRRVSQITGAPNMPEGFTTTELPVYTPAMNEITREEFNAKIETIEVKMDSRVEAVSSKIDGFLGAQAERDKRLDAVMAQIIKDHDETKSSISSMKSTLIVTAISAVLAIVLGIAGFNTALTSNMLSAFQLGKSDQPASQAATPSKAATATPAASSPPGQQQQQTKPAN